MELVRGINRDRTKRVLVCAIAAACAALKVTVLAEGIETADEHDALCDIGVTLQQGYLFARPAFQALAQPAWRMGKESRPVLMEAAGVAA